MKLLQLGEVELRRLQDLRLPYVHVLERVDGTGRLLDLAADRLWDELLDELLEVDVRRLTGHDLEHLLPDLPDLG